MGWYCICGLPFSSGFFSKDAILDGVLEQSETFGDFKFQRRLTVTTVSSVYKTVRIVVTPYIGGKLMTAQKDSLLVSRTKPAGSPLCTSC